MNFIKNTKFRAALLGVAFTAAIMGAFTAGRYAAHSAATSTDVSSHLGAPCDFDRTFTEGCHIVEALKLQWKITSAAEKTDLAAHLQALGLKVGDSLAARAEENMNRLAVLGRSLPGPRALVNGLRERIGRELLLSTMRLDDAVSKDQAGKVFGAMAYLQAFHVTRDLPKTEATTAAVERVMKMAMENEKPAPAFAQN